MVTDAHRAVERQHAVARRDHVVRQREIGVGQDDAEQQRKVGFVDHRADVGRAGGAEIGAEQRVRAFEQAAAHEGRDHRHVELVGERGDPFLDAIAADFDVHDDDRRLGLREPRENLLCAFRHRIGVGGRALQHPHRRDLRHRHVAGKFDVDGQRTLARRAQHARDLGRRGFGVAQHRLIAGHLVENIRLRVDGARLMMQHEAAGPLARAGRARDHHHRRAFGIGAGDRVDQVEGSGPVGNHRDAEAAVIARGRVRREADRRLMAQREDGRICFLR